MGHIPLLEELAVIAVIGVLVSVVLARLRLPTVAGLLLAGALVGPHALRLVHDVAAIEVLAEIGVVLLLFSIGLEFSLERLRAIARQVAVGGSIQVGLTIAATLGIFLARGETVARGVFFGMVFALSSTAIVLRALTDRQEIDAPHGRFIVGALIFQDLCVVPMVLLVPILGAGGGAGSAALDILYAVGKAAAVVVVTVVVARLVVPHVFRFIDAARSREVFLLGVLAICIGTAFLTASAGLSLALGAFLGGMIVADTEFGHRAMGEVMPLRDAFTSIFFVSLGMLFDVRAVLEEPLVVLAMLAGLLLAKGLLATLAAMAMRFPARVAWLAGVGLAQFGEFGFVLVKLGEGAGVVTAADTRALIAAGVISMFLTPVLVRVAPHVTAGERLLRPLERLLGVQGIDEQVPAGETRARHVIIVGYGLAGRLLADSLSRRGIPHLVLELNADTVRKGRKRGESVYYGDASSPEALEHAKLHDAIALVMLINDPAAAQRVVAAAKRLAPEIPVMVRARYLAEKDRLVELGASDVVAEEVEAGVEMLARVLRRVDLPRNDIDHEIHTARTTTQHSDRSPTVRRHVLAESAIADELRVENVQLREQSHATGRTLASLEVRSQTGALVVAIRREGKLLEDLDPQAALRDGDRVYLVGRSTAVRDAVALLDRGESRIAP